jgi:hypothetical protein
MGRVWLRVGHIDAGMDTHRTRVLEHAVGSKLKAHYEVSTRNFRSTDLERIC